MTSAETHLYRFGDFTLKPQEHSLLRNGQQIHLRPKAFETLVYLVERRGLLVKKDELLNSIWPDVIVTENTLSHCIDEVRQALEDSAREPRFVQTVPRLGFKFIAEVEALAHEDAEAQMASDETAVEPVKHIENATEKVGHWQMAGRFLSGSRLSVLGVLTVLISLVLFSVWGRKLINGDGPSIDSLAVLPFVNLSVDPGQDYFADGMTEALIANLAKIKALRVISRTSVMSYKKARKPLPEIARELNVDVVIEGSVLRIGDRVRIIVQLIQARTEQHLWVRTYERDVRDILTLQGDMARAIADEIQVELTPQESESMVAINPVMPTAYEAYLKGRYFLSQRSREGLEKALDFFILASKLDPNYPEADAGHADALIILSLMGNRASTTGMPQAAEMARRALRGDSTLAEAHTALAYVKMFYDWDWQGAEQEFKKAINLNPNYATAHHFYAMFLASQGRGQEALAEIRQALNLDPLSPIINSHHALLYYAQRKYDEAITQYEHTLELAPNFSFAYLWLGMVYLQKSSYAQAEASFKKALSIWPDNPRILSWLGLSYASAGKRAEALEMLDQLIQLSEQRYVAGYDIALVYLGLGDRERLFKWLDTAFQERDAMLVWLKSMPLYDPVRSDQRFIRLLDKIGFKS